MPQTLLALGALILVMLFSFNHQRATIRNTQDIVSTELEVMAMARGKEVMQLIGSKPFDARIADGTIGTQAGDDDRDLLTAPEAFGYGNSFDDCEDLDDFNKMLPDTIYFEVQDGLGFEFVVNADVYYVNSAGQESSSPTWVKEVKLMIDAVPGPGGMRYLHRPLEIKRQFSPQWN